MKTLHIYLTRQILASLVLTVLVFTFVLLIGNVLKDILSMIMNGQVGLGTVAKAIGLLVPFAWMFALPMGMLTATLLVFGRFSAEQELTAVRASGISLLALVSPILLLSILLCALSAVINLELGPRCRVAFTAMRFKLAAQLSSSLLPEGRFITDHPGVILYVGKNREGDLQDVMVLMFDSQTNLERTLTASTGKMVVRAAEKQVDITLFHAKTIEASGLTTVGDEFPVTIDLESPQKAAQEPKIDDMTYRQLWNELHELERRVRLPVTLKNLNPEQLKERRAQLQQQRKDLVTPILFQIHRQVAFSFACFGFTLLGIPLGIRVHRRETNIGIAIALVLVAVYYSFIIVGHALQHRPEFLPYMIVWIPNFLFQTVGAVLLWRANRGT
ncbi:MAG TPA: LptF/LptG family permease [Verrucomicrobiae bacterium]|nr:LptF/LptG family permease [Verrucomicrobiae bacterium]